MFSKKFWTGYPAVLGVTKDGFKNCSGGERWFQELFGMIQELFGVTSDCFEEVF